MTRFAEFAEFAEHFAESPHEKKLGRTSGKQPSELCELCFTRPKRRLTTQARRPMGAVTPLLGPDERNHS